MMSNSDARKRAQDAREAARTAPLAPAEAEVVPVEGRDAERRSDRVFEQTGGKSDVDALAEVLADARDAHPRPPNDIGSEELAEVVLASDWLTRYVATQRAEALREAAGGFERERIERHEIWVAALDSKYDNGVASGPARWLSARADRIEQEARRG